MENTNVNKSKRLFWADAIRGVLILTVVLGHALQHGDYEHNVCWTIIYSFHMAAFFVISGYVSYKDYFSWNIIPRRAKQLLIPYVVWRVLEVLCVSHSGVLVYDLVLHPDLGFWFIHSLFFVVLLFTFCRWGGYYSYG